MGCKISTSCYNLIFMAHNLRRRGSFLKAPAKVSGKTPIGLPWSCVYPYQSLYQGEGDLEVLIGQAESSSPPAWVCGEAAPSEPYGQDRISGGNVACQRKAELMNVSMMLGLCQDYISVCRESAYYLDTGLDMAVLQTDSYAEQSDPAQTCLRFPPPHPPSGQNNVGVAQLSSQPWPSLSLTLCVSSAGRETNTDFSGR